MVDHRKRPSTIPSSGGVQGGRMRARSLSAMARRLVIIGGGPAGHTAATHAARLGAEVTIIERDIIGGAAHLRDCIPSKAMIATGGALASIGRAHEMGLRAATTEVDPDLLRERIRLIAQKIGRAHV